MFVNLTPHHIRIVGGRGLAITVPVSGTVARVSTVVRRADDIDDIPCQVKSYGEIVGLPAEGAGDVFYIVSGMVLEALRQQGCKREDICAPATGPDDNAMRDASGHITCVTRLDVLV